MVRTGQQTHPKHPICLGLTAAPFRGRNPQVEDRDKRCCKKADAMGGDPRADRHAASAGLRASSLVQGVELWPGSFSSLAAFPRPPQRTTCILLIPSPGRAIAASLPPTSFATRMGQKRSGWVYRSLFDLKLRHRRVASASARPAALGIDGLIAPVRAGSAGFGV